MSEYETTTITIRRVLGESGTDEVRIEWDEDAPLIELLGMVEYARDSILRSHMGEETP